MPSLEELYLKTGQIITEDWFKFHYELHKSQIHESAVDFYGYIHKDLIPDTDLFFNIGTPLARIKEIHAGYGYFNALYKDGRVVLADGDPIYISDIYPEAREKITQAIDYSKLYEYTKYIHSDLLNIIGKLDVPVSEIKERLDRIYDYVTKIDSQLLELIGEFRPSLLAYQINYHAPELVDIFPDDILINSDGRVRVKILMSNSGYAYLKWTPSGTNTPVLGLLNAGDIIPANAWHEFDFTVMKNDKVNVRVSPSTNVTVFLYNIPNT